MPKYRITISDDELAQFLTNKITQDTRQKFLRTLAKMRSGRLSPLKETNNIEMDDVCTQQSIAEYGESEYNTYLVMPSSLSVVEVAAALVYKSKHYPDSMTEEENKALDEAIDEGLV